MGNDLIRPSAERTELAKRAALRPRNLAIGGGVIVAGVVVGLPSLFILLALIAYAVLIARDVTAAEAGTGTGGTQQGRVSPQTFAPEIASELEKAQATERAIAQAIAAADHPFEEISADVRMIVSQMETSAKRAQLIKDTLDDQGRSGHDERSIVAQIEKLRPRFGERDVRELVNDLEAQRRSHIALRESLERFKVNMARLNASLALMRNRLVEMSAAEEASLQSELAAQARDIRDRTERFTRVLEASTTESSDDLQRELDRDAAAKQTGPTPADAPRTVPMRNRAPAPAPKASPPKPPAPAPDAPPRTVPMRNRAAPAPAPAPKAAPPQPPDEGPRPVVPLRNRAKPNPKATPPSPPAPSPDGAPRPIDMRNRARDRKRRD